MRKNPYINTPIEEQPRPDAALLQTKLTEKLPEDAVSADQKPVVTVVTAVFNAIKDGRKEELLQCMDSVQAQTGVAIEHLIIDGASPDGTVELIKNYRNAKFTIRLLSEPDSGIYDAMNRGIWLARGKYVIFLNSDDYYFNPDGLAESVKRLEESGAGFSYAPIRVLSETTGLPVDHMISRPNVNVIFVEMPFSHQSMMIRLDAMKAINGFDLRYSSGADYNSVLRLIFEGYRACFVPVSFVAFRLGGYSFVNVDQSQQEVGTIFSRLYKKYLNADLSPEDGKRIYLTKMAPKELKQKQFPFACAAFGDAIGNVYQQTDIVDDDLLLPGNRLRSLNRNQSRFKLLRTAAQLLLTSPVCFAGYLRNYCRIRRHSGKTGAGEKACTELLSSLQAKRRTQKPSAAEKGNGKTVPGFPAAGVTNQDYWRTNGLYSAEPWGAWTGKKFSVFFKLPEGYTGRPLTAQVNVGGYVFPESPERTIDVVINGRKISRLQVKNLMPQPYSFHIPADAVTGTVLDIDFIADRAFIPNELGQSSDTRELGMTFRKFFVTTSEDRNGKAAD